MKHGNEYSEDRCLEYKENLRVSDDEVMEFLKRHGISSEKELMELNRDERNKIIYEIKLIKGVTIRQLSSITGISKSVIARIKRR